MQNKRKVFIVLLILIPIFSLQPYLFKTGLTYDGGLYASLGYSIYEHGSYHFNGSPGDVPPVFPILLALSFYLGEDGMYLIPLLSSIILLISSFFLLETRFNINYAFLGSLIIFSSTMIYTYSLYVLRDLLGVAFVMLSYLIYEKNTRKETAQKRLSLGALLALAFLTRYASLVFFIPIAVHAIYRREKWVISSITVSLLIIFPWTLWSYSHHGTPFIEHSTYYLSKLSLNGFYEDALRPFISWFFLPFFLTSMLGILKKFNDAGLKSFMDMYLLLLAFAFTSALFWPIKDERYLLIVVFPMVYFLLYLFSGTSSERLITLFLILGIVFQMNSSMNHVGIASQKYSLLEDSGHWLRDNTPENSKVMTQSFRQIAFYANRRTYEVPEDESLIDTLIQKNGVSYVMVDSYERTTPKYIYDRVEYYRLLRVFKDDSGYVEIYLVS